MTAKCPCGHQDRPKNPADGCHFRVTKDSAGRWRARPVAPWVPQPPQPDRLSRIAASLEEIKAAVVQPKVPAGPASPYLNVQQAAQYCGVAVQTIYNHRKRIARAPGVGKLLFTTSALHEWLATRPKRRRSR